MTVVIFTPRDPAAGLWESLVMDSRVQVRLTDSINGEGFEQLVLGHRSAPLDERAGCELYRTDR